MGLGGILDKFSEKLRLKVISSGVGIPDISPPLGILQE